MPQSQTDKSATHGARKVRDSGFRRLVDWVFGYDFFISYSHADGLNCPAELKRKLELAGFNAFLDTTGYVAGDDLQRATVRRIRMSRHLIVIPRPAAVVSKWVLREVQIHLARNRTPIVIDVNRTVATTPETAILGQMIRQLDWLRIEDQTESLDGPPSDECIRELTRSFKATSVFSHDGRLVLSWGEDGMVRVWEPATDTVILEYKHSGYAFGATFGPNEESVLSWSDDGTVWYRPIKGSANNKGSATATWSESGDPAALIRILERESGTRLRTNGDLDELNAEEWGTLHLDQPVSHRN